MHTCCRFSYKEYVEVCPSKGHLTVPITVSIHSEPLPTEVADQCFLSKGWLFFTSFLVGNYGFQNQHMLIMFYSVDQ